MIDWQSIDTLRFGEPVLLLFQHGEKGMGDIALNWVYDEGDHWGYWTSGGPNGGSDFERDEKPIAWAESHALIEAGIQEFGERQA